MLQPKDPGKMQRALKVQVMNHVTRQAAQLGRVWNTGAKIGARWNDIQSIRLRYALHCSELEEGSCGVCLVRGTRRGPPREKKKMYPPLKLEMVMLICCFALLTGWAGLVHVWIVTAQGNGKVRY
jgi:hypothetical protein